MFLKTNFVFSFESFSGLYFYGDNILKNNFVKIFPFYLLEILFIPLPFVVFSEAALVESLKESVFQVRKKNDFVPLLATRNIRKEN